MSTWAEFETAEPELAGRVRTLLDAGRHKTIATLRADGSPRISGIECEIVDGQLQFGSMPDARKGDDLKRDPRFALHGPTFHPVEGKEADAVKAAWVKIDVPQCGYCQSGQIMSAVSLLQNIPKPTDEDIDGAMAGNICRCATYHRIRAAIHNAAQSMEG